MATQSNIESVPTIDELREAYFAALDAAEEAAADCAYASDDEAEAWAHGDAAAAPTFAKASRLAKAAKAADAAWMAALFADDEAA